MEKGPMGRVGPVRGWPAGALRRPQRAALVALSTFAFGCVIPIQSLGTSADAGSAIGDGSSGGGPDVAIPVGNWMNATANLANMTSECGNLSFLSAKPDEDLLIAGIAKEGLWGSRNGGISPDGGVSWQALGTGPGSAVITNRTSAIVYDPQNSARYWESGIYNGSGVYETMDDGQTFVALGDAGHIDLVSIDLSDPARKTLLAGGHEQSQTEYLSTNGGMTWTNVGAGLPASTYCSLPLIIDAQTYLVGCGGFGGGTTGVYRTTNSGGSWSRMTQAGGMSAPLRASDKTKTIYWPSYPGQGLARSTDDGVTWTTPPGSTVLSSWPPVELPDGRVAALGQQYVMVSSDRGATWVPASGPLPYNTAVGLAYSAYQKAFYIWHRTCGTGADPVPDDAIMRFAFDYQTQ